MQVYSDGTLIRTFKISLGAADTPTYTGTAVVISKSNPQLMVSSRRRTGIWLLLSACGLAGALAAESPDVR